MAATITVSDVVSFLESTGYTCDEGTIECIIETINASADTCFDANGYADCTVKLIKIYLSSLMCITSGSQKIQSEKDLSGDSITFDTSQQTQSQLSQSIRALDKNGCVTSLIPATNGAYMRVIGNLLS